MATPQIGASTGIIGQARNAGMGFTDYGGQQVRNDSAYMDQLKANASTMNMDPQAYDKMLNPTTYGARWGVPATQGGPTGIATAAPPQNSAPPKIGGGIIGKARGGGNNIVPPAPVATPASSVAPATNASISQIKGADGAYGYSAAQLGDPTQWNIDQNQTVSGQVAGIINQGSPLLQQAEADARARSNSMGLANSSMAATAGQDALYRTALPIAQQDASTYAKSAGYNADESNQFKTQNATFQNQAAANSASGANQIRSTQIGADASMANAQLSSSTQKYVSDQSSATQQAVAKMDTTSQQLISSAHDANSVLLQNNQSAQQAYSNYVNAVANIDIQTTMDVDAKQKARDIQTAIFDNAITGIKAATPQTPDISSPVAINQSSLTPQPVAAAVQSVNGVDVSGQLNFRDMR